MFDVLVENWWVMVVRGGLAVLFGLLALLTPGLTLGLLVALFAAYAAVEGVLTALTGWQLRGSDARAHPMIWEGLAGVAAAIVVVLWPDITAFVLLLVVAVWAIATGVLELFLARRLRGAIDGDWLLAVAGAASIVFGIALIAFPDAGSLSVVWWLGCFALVYGAVLIALGLRMRGAGKASGGMLAT
jgi:uncharacterized membrane protein HdeD (DUF308 family)